MFLNSTINELDVLRIEHTHFSALILHQGAQLIEFKTKNHSENWLFVSDANEYQQGKAIRGGIPICWPVFGAFDKNLEAVKTSFEEPLGQHGYARSEIWIFETVEENDDEITAIFSLATKHRPNLSAKAIFKFSADGFEIELISTNNEEKTMNFSQALHTYFPTSDIHKTAVTGFEDMEYIDTLTTNWQAKTQEGAILFTGETDRIYKTGSNCEIRTPETTFKLQAKNSNSSVVWNPWVEKSKGLSQFNNNDYQRMLCVETANAFEDYITLAPKLSSSICLKVINLTN